MSAIFEIQISPVWLIYGLKRQCEEHHLSYSFSPLLFDFTT